MQRKSRSQIGSVSKVIGHLLSPPVEIGKPNTRKDVSVKSGVGEINGSQQIATQEKPNARYDSPDLALRFLSSGLGYPCRFTPSSRFIDPSYGATFSSPREPSP